MSGNTSICFLLMLLLLISTGCKKDKNSGPSGIQPIITSINPSSGPKGTIVTVTGTGFGSVMNDINCYVNGKTANIINLTDTELQLIVPAKAGPGLVSLAVNNNTASGPYFEFEYTVTVSNFSGQPQAAGFVDGAPGSARFNAPRGLTIDLNGNLYVADEINNRIRRISPSGDVVSFAGSGVAGHADGAPNTARFNRPYDIELDVINNYLYVADYLNHCVRKITLNGFVSTLAGIPGTNGYVDGPGQLARLNGPTGIALEGEQVNIYVADAGNHCIRQIDVNEIVTTFAGSTTIGNVNAIGSGAKFNSPYDIAWDASGFLFVSDVANHNIRKIAKNNRSVTTVAGTGTAGYLNGQGVVARFNAPRGISANNGEVIVCDRNNNRIRGISPAKLVSALAGDGVAGYQNGSGLQTRFNKPGGIVRNQNGDYFISDTDNHCIRKMIID